MRSDARAIDICVIVNGDVNYRNVRSVSGSHPGRTTFPALFANLFRARFCFFDGAMPFSCDVITKLP